MELRPYQKAAIDGIRSQWQSGKRRTLLVLPTGCGKTIVFCKLAEQLVRQGHRVLIMAHRGELLEQAADKLYQATGLRCATEKAEETCLGSWYRVAVGSVQSLQRPKRLEQFPADYFTSIIVDEAHHCLSDGYQRVLEHFPDANVLGVTATPDRGDMRNLGQYFDSLAYEYTLAKAIREGYLSPIKAETIPLKLDLGGVGIQSGDFKAGDLGTALDPYLHSIAQEMAARCANRKTVVFLPLVKTSQKFRDILNAAGFQAAEVNGESPDRNQVRRLILTCSGGPFYGRSRQELQYVTRADALCHPNWRMGAKITIDCATLMNKGLELIEAMRLYRLPMEQVSVVIHRQSVVHSLVEYVDGAVLAQLGTPDMRLPIQLALTWPDRAPCPAPALDLLSCGPLTFDKPDLETFPCLGLAMEAAKAGGTAGAVLSGANEVAVGLYLLDQVGFYDIYDLVKQALDRVPFVEKPNLDQILAADRLAREAVYANLGG